LGGINLLCGDGSVSAPKYLLNEELGLFRGNRFRSSGSEHIVLFDVSSEIVTIFVPCLETDTFPITRSNYSGLSALGTGVGFDALRLACDHFSPSPSSDAALHAQLEESRHT
jgi:hypothetical protein